MIMLTITTTIIYKIVVTIIGRIIINSYNEHTTIRTVIFIEIHTIIITI